MKDLGFIKRDRYGEVSLDIYKKRVKSLKAEIAEVCIEKWGMVAAQPDGEDSSGRQKGRLSTPAELVDRACTVADSLVTEFEKREWFLYLPEPGNKSVPKSKL